MGNSSKEESGSDGEDSSGDVPDSISGLFSEGEKVLAYHGPRIYEAKVQKAELRKKEWRYFVHYLGWNKNWDEWVGMDRLLKHTDENIAKQQTLEKKQVVERVAKPGRSSQTKSKASSEIKVEKEEAKPSVSRSKKRKHEPPVEKDTDSVDKLVRIQIPQSLKKQLVEEWESISHHDKLLKLPRSPTVDEILSKYLEHRSKKDGLITDSTGEILKGIRCYFDKGLSAMLLYKEERNQYKEAVKNDASPSTVYGAEHLLRLFVKLPELLAYVNIEKETLTSLQEKLQDFLKYLQKNQSVFFQSAYETSKHYEGKHRGHED